MELIHLYSETSSKCLRVTFEMISIKNRLYAIDSCRSFGPNLENTNLKMDLYLPSFTFLSDVFTANLRLLSFFPSSTDFVMNFTASNVALCKTNFYSIPNLIFLLVSNYRFGVTCCEHVH